MNKSGKMMASFLYSSRAVIIATAVLFGGTSLYGDTRENADAMTIEDYIALFANEDSTIAAKNSKDIPATDIVETYRISGEGTTISTEVYDDDKDGYIINFNDLSIIEVIRFISKISEVNFIFEEEDLDFNVTIVSEGPTSIENVMAALLQILRIHEFSLLQQDNTIVIHKNRNVANPPALLINNENNIAIVTDSFRVRHLDTVRLSDLLKPYLSQDAIINTSPETGHIIITDINTNVEKIGELLDILDVPNRSLELSSYKVQNLTISILIDLAKKILDPLSEGGTLELVPQIASGTIFIVSSPYLIQRTIAVLKTLDRGEPLAGQQQVVSSEDATTTVAWPYEKDIKIKERKQTIIENLEDRIRYARREKEEKELRENEMRERAEKEKIYDDLEKAIEDVKNYTLEDDEDTTNEIVRAMQNIRKSIADLDSIISVRMDKEIAEMEALIENNDGDVIYDNLKRFEEVREELRDEERRAFADSKELITLIRSLETSILQGRERYKRYEQEAEKITTVTIEKRAVIKDVVIALEEDTSDKEKTQALIGRVDVLGESVKKLSQQAAKEREELIESVKKALNVDKKSQELEEKKKKEETEALLQNLSGKLIQAIKEDSSFKEDALKKEIVAVKDAIAEIENEANERENRILKELSKKESEEKIFKEELRKELEYKNAIEAEKNTEKEDIAAFFDSLQKGVDAKERQRLEDINDSIKAIALKSYDDVDEKTIYAIEDAITRLIDDIKEGQERWSAEAKEKILEEIGNQSIEFSNALSKEREITRESLVKELEKQEERLSKKSSSDAMKTAEILIEEFEASKKTKQGKLSKEQKNLVKDIVEIFKEELEGEIDRNLAENIAKELAEEDAFKKALAEAMKSGIEKGEYEKDQQDDVERYVELLEYEREISAKLLQELNIIEKEKRSQEEKDALAKAVTELERYIKDRGKYYDKVAENILTLKKSFGKDDDQDLVVQVEYIHDALKELSKKSAGQVSNELLFARLFDLFEGNSQGQEDFIAEQRKMLEVLEDDILEGIRELATKIASKSPDSKKFIENLKSWNEDNDKREDDIKEYIEKFEDIVVDIKNKFDERYKTRDITASERRIEAIQNNIEEIQKDIAESLENKEEYVPDSKEEALKEYFGELTQQFDDIRKDIAEKEENNSAEEIRLLLEEFKMDTRKKEQKTEKENEFLEMTLEALKEQFNEVTQDKKKVLENKISAIQKELSYKEEEIRREKEEKTAFIVKLYEELSEAEEALKNAGDTSTETILSKLVELETVIIGKEVVSQDYDADDLSAIENKIDALRENLDRQEEEILSAKEEQYKRLDIFSEELTNIEAVMYSADDEGTEKLLEKISQLEADVFGYKDALQTYDVADVENIENKIADLKKAIDDQKEEAAAIKEKRYGLIESIDEGLSSIKKISYGEEKNYQKLIEQLNELENELLAQNLSAESKEEMLKDNKERENLILRIRELIDYKRNVTEEGRYTLEEQLRNLRKDEEERAEIEDKFKERTMRTEISKDEKFEERSLRKRLERKSRLERSSSHELSDVSTFGAPDDKTDFFIYKLEHQDGGEIVSSLVGISEGIAAGNAIPGLSIALENVRYLSASNSVLITGTKEVLKKIRVLVSNMDIPIKQVFVEMLVVETTIADSLTFGVEWGAQMKRDNILLDGVGGFLSDDSELGEALQTLTKDAALDADEVPLTSGFSMGVIGRVLNHNDEIFTSIGALVKALSTDSNTEIILNPQIVSEEGNTAEFFVGDTIRYRTSAVTQTGGNVEATYETGMFGTSLKVTPRLGNRVDVVTLDIEQSISDVTSTTEIGPQTQTSTTKTRVHIPDKNFLVLSGMIKEKDRTTKRKVPILGSIPIIGTLFKSETHSKDKRNIMIFIRPHIISNEEDIKALTQSRRELYKKGVKFDDYDYDEEEMKDILGILDEEE